MKRLVDLFWGLVELFKTAENTRETRKGMGLKYKVILFPTKIFWWLFMTSYHHTEQHDRT